MSIQVAFKTYWKTIAGICGGITLVGGTMAAMGLELQNPFVMRSEYETFATNRKTFELDYHLRQKREIEYQIYLIKRDGKRIPQILNEKLNFHIEEIRKLRRRR